MPSKLENLIKALAWSDFTKVTKTKPEGDQLFDVAETKAGVVPFNFSAEAVPNSKPQVFRLKDEITMTIKLDSTSWVASWVFSEPKTEQDRLLKHEQGHYDLVALLARDWFIEVMALKAKTFASPALCSNAVTAINQKFGPKLAAIHTKYDDKTNHGDERTEQAAWDGHIKTAFTQERSPRTVAPDGTAYKTPILDVLSKAGIVV